MRDLVALKGSNKGYFSLIIVRKTTRSIAVNRFKVPTRLTNQFASPTCILAGEGCVKQTPACR